MRKCRQCGADMNDNSLFCTKCGTKLEEQKESEFQQNADAGYQQQYRVPVDPYDHTAEFDPIDISENKVFAMLCYLMGVMGIIIALLASKTSKYTAFHVRQALKFEVVTILAGLASMLLFWTVIVPLVAGGFMIVLWVCRIIAFFSICKGKACEPPIIKNLNFLK